MDFRHLAAKETETLIDRLATALTTEVESVTKQIQAIQASADRTLADAQAELAQAKSELEQARADEETLRTAFGRLRNEAAALRSDVEKGEEQREALQSILQERDAQKKELEQRLDTVSRTVEQMKQLEERLEERLAAADKAAAASRTERDALADTMQRAEANWKKESQSLREQSSTVSVNALDHVRAVFDELDAAPTAAQALQVLLNGLAAEFPRVALFHVNGNKLQGRHQVGFEFESDISKVVVPLSEGTVLTDAVRSGKARGYSAQDHPNGSHALFGGAPSFVLILPLGFETNTPLVLYADNSGRNAPTPAEYPRVLAQAEILRRHAAPMLVRLSAQERVLGELGEYASHLLSSLELVYGGDVKAGHSGDELLRRLQVNLEYARGMFTQRATPHGPFGTAVFDQHLTTLAKSGSSLGRDLTKLGRTSPAIAS